MRRVLVLGYGVLVYAFFLVVLIALADFGTPTAFFVRSLDEGAPTSTGEALAINLLLVAVFGISHSILARASVKRVIIRFIPRAAERSTYVLVASLTLALLVWQWRPLPDVLWHIGGPLRVVPWTVQAIGVALLLYSTFLTDHFDLFGLRQVWLYAQRRTYVPVPFVERSLYRHVRHPMMLGLLLWLWAPVTMTLGHLAFSAAMTAYILIGIAFEERSLGRELGAAYADYRLRVPALVPRLRGSPRGRSPRPV